MVFRMSVERLTEENQYATSTWSILTVKKTGQDDISALFDEWNGAIQTGNPENVAALYEEGTAILLPTMSSKVRHDHEEIADYFVQFLAEGPVGRIDEGNVRIFGEIAINSGLYTFTFEDDSSVQARFTFVYRWNGQRWMIVEHHSSAMPG